MHRKIAVLISLVIAPSVLAAQASSDWKNVERLKPDKPVTVVLTTGETIKGRVDWSTDDKLAIQIKAGDEPVHADALIDRISIRKITLARRPRIHSEYCDGPDCLMAEVYGAFWGGIAGDAVGAIEDGEHGGHSRVPTYTGRGAAIAAGGTAVLLFWGTAKDLVHSLLVPQTVYATAK